MDMDGRDDRPHGLTDAWLVYDGECPVCRAYCLRVRIDDAVGRLHLVDAREPSPLMDEITALGLDIDQGMVLKFEDVIYYGPEAVRMLTLLGTRVGWFNRLAVAFFGGTRRANFWYPISKAARNVVLKLLGIRYIDNLGQAKRESMHVGCDRDSR
jgi:predicted DCC family thiol-disulfide oxidoreductase YuxK